MKLLRLPQFDAGVHEAMNYYKAIDPKLGLRFLHEFEAALQRMMHMLRSWKPIGSDCRRCALKVFPYWLAYLLEDEQIIFVALVNTHRRPDYWRERFKD